MKVVVNCCYGGFGLSNEAIEWLVNKKGWVVTELTDEREMVNPNADLVVRRPEKIPPWYDFCKWGGDEKELRANLALVECVETLGEKANDWASNLKILEVPDDVGWYISEYDGWETVEEKHRSWECEDE